MVTPRSKSETSAVRPIAAAKTRCLGTRSASWPAGRASTSIGRNSQSPISPRSNAEWRIENTCQPIATATMFTPRLSETSEDQNRK
jgi:hypothetical protein